MLDKRLLPSCLVSFLEDLNGFLAVSENGERLELAQTLIDKFLSGSNRIVDVQDDVLAVLKDGISKGVAPPRDGFVPVVLGALSSLQVITYLRPIVASPVSV